MSIFSPVYQEIMVVYVSLPTSTSECQNAIRPGILLNLLWEVLASICGNSGSYRGSTRTVDPTWSFQRKPCVLVHFFWVKSDWVAVSMISRIFIDVYRCLSNVYHPWFCVPFIWHYFVLGRRGAWASWISTANHSMQTCNWWGTVDPFIMDASR